MKVLLRRSAKVNLEDSEGRTPLIDAFTEGVGVVQTLLQHGADTTLGQMPPTYHAAASGDVEIIQALIDAGADCNVRISKSSLHEDIPESEPLLLHLAHSHFNTGKEQERTLAIINLLLRHLQPRVDIENISGNGSLTLSVVAARRGFIESFVSFGLELEARDPNGLTSILVAYKHRSGPATIALMEADAHVMVVGNHKMSPLHYLTKNQTCSTFMEK